MPRDHFEVVAVRVAEIDAAPAVVMVDLAGPATSRISPVSEAAILDAAEDGVPSASTKSSETPLSNSTTSKWPKRVGTGRPSISARNLAEALWFELQTMV